MVGHSDCNKCCNNQQSCQIVSLCGDPCSCLYRGFPLGSIYLMNLNLNLNFPFIIFLLRICTKKNNYLGFEDKIIFSKKHIGHCCFGLFFLHKKLNIKNTVVPLK